MNPLLAQMSQEANRDPRLIASLIATHCEKQKITRKQLAVELELSQEQLAKLGLCRIPEGDNLAAQAQQITSYVGISATQLRRFLRNSAPEIYKQRRPHMIGAWLEELVSMFSRRRVVAYGMAAIVILVVSAFAFAQPPTGTEATLVVSEGEATVVQDNRLMLVVPNRTETAVAAGSILAVGGGDTIRLPTGAAAQLKLSDGSTVNLAAETTLQISELVTTEETYRVRLRLLAGRTVNRVVRLLGQDDTFDVQTPSSTASVRGTIFTVDVISPSETYVSCDEGIVRVTMAGNFVDLHPGEEVMAILGQPLTVRSQNEETAPAEPAPLPPTAAPEPLETAVPPTPTATSTAEPTVTATETQVATPASTDAISATITPVAVEGELPDQVPGNPPDDVPGEGDPPDSGGIPPGQEDKDPPDTGPPGQVPGNPPGDNPGQGDPPDGGGTPPGQGGSPPGQNKPPKDKD